MLPPDLEAPEIALTPDERHEVDRLHDARESQGRQRVMADRIDADRYAVRAFVCMEEGLDADEYNPQAAIAWGMLALLAELRAMRT